MHKTQRKIDNNVRRALTAACSRAEAEVPGFAWLTHFARWDNFPASLRVVCVFATEGEKADALAAGLDDWLQKCVQAELIRVGIVIKAIRHTLILDSEEACAAAHEGNWARRLQQWQGQP